MRSLRGWVAALGAHSFSYKLQRQRMRSRAALVMFAPARVARPCWRGLWQTPWPLYGSSGLRECLGIPAMKCDGARDVIALGVACYCEQRCVKGSSASDALACSVHSSMRGMTTKWVWARIS